jgi:hypothetical protein
VRHFELPATAMGEHFPPVKALPIINLSANAPGPGLGMQLMDNGSAWIDKISLDFSN